MTSYHGSLTTMKRQVLMIATIFFISVDCQLTMKSAEVTKPHRTGHAIMWKLTGEKYWKCARVILVTFFLIQHKG